MWQFLLEGEEVAATTGDLLAQSLPMIGIILIFVVFLIFSTRSQKKQEREQAEMRDNLQIGDEITTIGGIIGQIVALKGETMTIVTTNDKTKIRFLRTALRSVDRKVTGETPDKKPDSKPEIPQNNG